MQFEDCTAECSLVVMVILILQMKERFCSTGIVLYNCSLVPCIYREDYKHYLSRPDLKQELVTQWQKDFNSIPDDMRDDEETKAELHLRMDVRRMCNIIQCMLLSHFLPGN